MPTVPKPAAPPPRRRQTPVATGPVSPPPVAVGRGRWRAVPRLSPIVLGVAGVGLAGLLVATAVSSLSGQGRGASSAEPLVQATAAAVQDAAPPWAAATEAPPPTLEPPAAAPQPAAATPAAIAAAPVAVEPAAPTSPAVPATPNLADAWASLLSSIADPWNHDWPTVIDRLAAFRRTYPDFGPAQDKLYVALLASGQSRVAAGDVDAGRQQLEQAQGLLPARPEAPAALATLAAPGDADSSPATTAPESGKPGTTTASPPDATTPGDASGLAANGSASAPAASAPLAVGDDAAAGSDGSEPDAAAIAAANPPDDDTSGGATTDEVAADSGDTTLADTNSRADDEASAAASPAVAVEPAVAAMPAVVAAPVAAAAAPSRQASTSAGGNASGGGAATGTTRASTAAASAGTSTTANRTLPASPARPAAATSAHSASGNAQAATAGAGAAPPSAQAAPTKQPFVPPHPPGSRRGRGHDRQAVVRASRPVRHAHTGALVIVISSILVMSTGLPVARAIEVDCWEPYDNPDTPCPLSDGGVVHGYIKARGGVDYFQFSTQLPGTHAHISLDELPADYDLYLADANAQLIAQSMTSGLAPELIDMNLDTPGDYNLYVVSDPSVDNDPDHAYVLTIGLTPPAPPARARRRSRPPRRLPAHPRQRAPRRRLA